MEENEKMNNREELFSRPVRAGKRTYFFDVKATRNDEKYVTITESKRRFNEDQNHFSYEKHKIFLYKEDFEKFANALRETLNYIETGEYPEGYFDEPKEYEGNDEPKDDVENWFDSLGNN
ncbi:MAG: PUR family DNA/RNA-binding protein [Bacteroidales bacterium]|nr:PUR family DNA/RNA-binding protein [Bacteroidales bacterium]MCQ2322363.1 PUR family DNA/RNA-binding protein [Bacteroidales bacterium]